VIIVTAALYHAAQRASPGETSMGILYRVPQAPPGWTAQAHVM